MYRKYRIVESIGSSVSQYKSYRDQVYRYTPNLQQTREVFPQHVIRAAGNLLQLP